MRHTAVQIFIIVQYKYDFMEAMLILGCFKFYLKYFNFILEVNIEWNLNHIDRYIYKYNTYKIRVKR